MNSLENEDRQNIGQTAFNSQYGATIDEILISEPSNRLRDLRRYDLLNFNPFDPMVYPSNADRQLLEDVLTEEQKNEFVPTEIQGFALGPIAPNIPLDGNALFFLKVYKGFEFDYEQCKAFLLDRSPEKLNDFLFEIFQNDWRDFNIDETYEPLKALFYSVFFKYLVSDTQLGLIPLNTFTENANPTIAGNFLSQNFLGGNIQQRFRIPIHNDGGGEGIRVFMENFFANDYLMEQMPQGFLSINIKGDYNIQNLFHHKIVSFELYSLFLIFFYKILTIGFYLQGSTLDPNGFQWNIFKNDARHPNNMYMKFYPLYLNLMQEVSFEIYVRIIRKIMRTTSGGINVSIPSEFGGIKYMDFDSGPGGFFLDQEQHDVLQMPTWNLNLIKNLHELYPIFDDDELFPSLELKNPNLYNLLEKYWKLMYTGLRRNTLSLLSVNVIVGYYATAASQGAMPLAAGSASNLVLNFTVDINNLLEKEDFVDFDTFFARFLSMLWIYLENELIERALRYMDQDEYDFFSKELHEVNWNRRTYNVFSLGFDTTQLWKNVRILGWKMLHLNAENRLEIQNALQAFHSEDKKFESWMNIFKLSAKKNCMFQLLSYFIFREEKITITEDLLIIAYFRQNYQEYLKKILKFIDNGAIVELLKILNKHSKKNCYLLYVYFGNCLYFKEMLFNSEIHPIHIVLYRNNIGILSIDRFEEMKKMRENQEYPKIWIPFYDKRNKKDEDNTFTIFPSEKKPRKKKPKEIEQILTLESHEMLKENKKNKKKEWSLQSIKSSRRKKRDFVDIPEVDINNSLIKMNNMDKFFMQEKQLNFEDIMKVDDENKERFALDKNKKLVGGQNKFFSHKIKKCNGKIFKKKKTTQEIRDDNVWGWDCETRLKKDGSFKVWCICIYNLGEKKLNQSFWGKKCILDFALFLLNLLSTEENNYFYSFNGARFDNIFLLLPFISFFNGNVKYVGNMSNIKILTISETIFFYDLRLILVRGSLNSLSESILKKKKIDFDIVGLIGKEKKFEYELQKDKIIKYCFKDCKLVVLLVENLRGFLHYLFEKFGKLEEFADFNVYQPTLSVLTLNCWRKLCNSNISLKGVNHIGDYERIKSSYKGGCCIPLKKRILPNSRLYHYDINSSYPHIMHDSLIPTEILDYKMFDANKYPSLTKPPRVQIKTDCLYEVYFKFKSNVLFPYFPIKVKEGLAYVSECLDQSCWIWGGELEYAIGKKHLDELIVKSYYKFKMDRIFNKYISVLWEERKNEKEESKKMWLKLFMNSLYGKFGQKQFDHREIIHTSKLQEFLTIWDRENIDKKLEKNYLKNIVHIKNQDNDGGFWELSFPPDVNFNYIGSLVFISSFIASQARINLVFGMYEIGIEHVYYFDTDSIFSDKILKEKYVGGDLGQWKLEEDDIIDGFFLAPKVYCFRTASGKEVLHCKGIPTKLLKWKDFIKIYEEKTFSYHNISQMLHRHDQIHLQENITKTLRLLDNKRIYDDLNNTSKPFNNINEFLNQK